MQRCFQSKYSNTVEPSYNKQAMAGKIMCYIRKIFYQRNLLFSASTVNTASKYFASSRMATTVIEAEKNQLVSFVELGIVSHCLAAFPKL